MAALPKVAVAGATGNLGPSIVTALLKEYAVTVLTRSGSTSAAPKLPSNPNLHYVEADYTSTKEALSKILAGHLAVISTLPAAAIDLQKRLMDAVVLAHVPRFIPSTFGSDSTNPLAASLPGYQTKVAAEAYLEQLAKQHKLSYVSIACGPFLDWCMTVGLFLDGKTRSIELYDGGDQRFSATRLSSVGEAVLAVMRNWADVADRTVRVHDGVFTQNQLLALAKEATPGETWQTTTTETAGLEAWARERYAEGDDGMGPFYACIKRAIWGDGFGAEFKETDNAALGLGLISESELKSLVSSMV